MDRDLVRNRKPIAAALAVLALAVGPAAVLGRAAPARRSAAPRPAAERSDADVRRDIEFARGLAESWGFVDLAEQVLADVAKAGVSGRRAEDLALAHCEVFAVGARNSRDPARRNQLYDQALDAYQRFLREHAQSGRKADAEAGFVRVSSEYARSLGLAAEEATGEEVERLRKRQEEVLSDAVTRTGDLISSLKVLDSQNQLSEGQRRELYDLMLDRGRMLLEIAKTQEDGSFNYEQSLAVLEDLVFTAGEGTPYALRAYAVMGENYLAQGKLENAALFYREVVDQAITRDRAKWDEVAKEATPAEKEMRWLFVQLGTTGLIDALLADGRTEDAVAWGLHLYNTQRREGFSFLPIGYLSLLTSARALLEAGGWIGGSTASGDTTWYATLDAIDKAGVRARDRLRAFELALHIAEMVNRDNQGNTLQLRAQKLISDAIDRPGVEVSPDVLIEAAMGAYNGRDWPAAVQSFKRVLRAVNALDEQSRRLYAPKTLFHLGASYQRQERLLEAAACYEEGCTRWLGDPEFDEKNAQGFYSSVRRLAAAWPTDTTLAARASRSEQIVTQVSSNVGAIVFRQAEKLRQEKEFEAAIAKYKEVTAGDNDYEKALVKIGHCEYRLGRADAALKTFQNYLGPFVEDPANATTSPARLQRRQEARAEALFFSGLILFEKAQAGEVPWEQVVEALAGYEDEFPEQNVMAPWSMRHVVLAELALGDTNGARTTLAKMVERFPDSIHAGSAAIEVYKALETRRAEALKASDAALATTILREMAELLKLGNETDRTPSWPNLRRETEHWIEIGEWVEAERVLRKSREAFADDAERQKDIERYVLPDLALVLLRQQKATESLAILDPLAKGEDKRPPKEVAQAYARAVTGWVDGTDKPFSIVPGAGLSDEQFKQATKYLDQLTNSAEKYSCEWVQTKFELAYAYWIWGQKDSKMLESARNVISPLEADYGPGFPEVERRCQTDGEPERGKVLRRKLNWLKEKL